MRNHHGVNVAKKHFCHPAPKIKIFLQLANRIERRAR